MLYICPRFKKGNLRLLQTEEGDWKLEELQEEKRRSLDGGNNSSNNNNNNNNNNNASFEDEEAEGEEEVVVRETPVKSRKERRKKSSQGSEEGGRSESQLLRRSFIAVFLIWDDGILRHQFNKRLERLLLRAIRSPFQLADFKENHILLWF